MGFLRRTAACLAAVLALSCGARDADAPALLPSAVSGTETRLAASSDPPAPPAPSPVAPWVPPGTFACPLGNGDPQARCTAGAEPAFAAEVDAAVHRLLAEQPELFDREVVEAGDRYLVRDAQRFHEAMAAVLQARGFCAGWDLRELQVKNENGFSEQYLLVQPDGGLHSGPESFRGTCRPASFPLEAKDRIHFVRVGFYGIDCDDLRTPPRNGELRLPLGCTGYVTATPKDERGDDVDARIHGPNVTWEIQQRYEYVRVQDFAGVPFNKVLRAQERGDFRLCATVEGHTSCMDARVTAN